MKGRLRLRARNFIRRDHTVPDSTEPPSQAEVRLSPEALRFADQVGRLFAVMHLSDTKGVTSHDRLVVTSGPPAVDRPSESPNM